MRIIHTADWHLCDRLGRHSRIADLEERVEKVAGYCEEHQVDALIIAGDLFFEGATLDEMHHACDFLGSTFAGFFRRGGTILAVTGNHDRDNKINVVRSGMKLAAPMAGGPLQPGRMYLLNSLSFGPLTSPRGDTVQFAFVPYPQLGRYNISAKDYPTREQGHEALHQAVADWITSLPRRDNFRSHLPTVLIAHLHVRGSELHNLYKLDARDDVLFNFADLNTSWAYVALGHIHKPQMLHCATNVQYPGSLDRLDFGDQHDNHGVLLLEIERSGLKADPVRLTIPPTPFYTIELQDPETEIPTLAERYPDHERAFARITLHRGRANEDEILRQLRRIFPRLHEVTWSADPERTATTPGAGSRIDPHLGLKQTVRQYLELNLQGDPDRQDLLQLAEEFLALEVSE